MPNKNNNAPIQPVVKDNINNVIAVMSGKGGVGKSTIAGLIASSLQRKNFKVGLLDADITGPSIPTLFGLSKSPPSSPEGILPVITHSGIEVMSINLLLPDKDQPVIWRGPLIGRAIQQFWSDIQWGALDFLIIDLPPGTADAALTVMQLLPLDGIVLITSPQDLAGMVVRKAGNMAIHLGIPVIGIVENMSYTICPTCGECINLFGISKAQNTAQMLGSNVMGRVLLDTNLTGMCDQGEIENYQNPEFDSITETIIQFAYPEEMKSHLNA